MGFHDLHFPVVQRAGLVENFLGNADFADVVQRGQIGNHRNVRFAQRIAVGQPDQPVQQHVREYAHVQNVGAGLVVAGFDDMAEHVDHGAAVFFALIDLLLHQMHQLLLPGIEKKRVAHAALNDGQIEGAVDIVHRAEVVGLLDNVHVLLGGEDDDRNFIASVLLL